MVADPLLYVMGRDGIPDPISVLENREAGRIRLTSKNSVLSALGSRRPCTGYWPGYARRNLKNALPGASICSAAVERSNGFAWESDRGERIVNKRRIGLDCF